MSEESTGMIRKPLRSPRAAGIAGVIFAFLLGLAMVLTQWSIPDGALDDSTWLEERGAVMGFAMGLLPFAGIAFLWFIGVIRDQIGDLEDRLFATVFLGSGLLFLATLFVWAGLVWASIAAYGANPSWGESDTFLYAAAMIQIMAGTFTLRMAGVFVISASSIWMRTQIMPRWLVVLSLALAVVLLIGGSNIRWLRLAFPVWVLVVSIIILIRVRQADQEAEAGA